MTPDQKEIVQSTWSQVIPIADVAADLFYDRLFEIAPEVKPLFPTDIKEQKKKLMATVSVAVSCLDELDTLVPVLQQLGARHNDYGVQAEHYKPVGEALLWTLEQGLGEKFTAEAHEAWVVVYTVIAQTMQEAAAASYTTSG